MATSVLVFTRDLRVADNPALAAAAEAGEVVPLFVFDDAILRGRRHASNATRMAFLLDSLRDLDASLRQRGGRLVTRRGDWAQAALDVAIQAGAGQIHLAEDVSGYASRRLDALRSLCARHRREVITHPGVMVTAAGAISPAGSGPRGRQAEVGAPYQVFTPYYRRWLRAPRRKPADPPVRIALPDGVSAGPLADLASLTSGQPAAGAPGGGETAGQHRLARWAGEHLASYERSRDDLAADLTSRISPYLHFGCLSPLAVATGMAGLLGGESFVRQLAWRDFFCQLLAAKPDAAHRDYRDSGARWHDDEDGLAAWQAGRTGYPVVDAAMRQLASEGFMPNRARMIVASFLTKDLSIDWRAGAAHFMAHLADADVACNQLNWQWVAGTGTDTQRHRVFSPIRQGRRFDPDGAYIRRHLPEFGGLSAAQVHDPDPQVRRSRRYPPPIIDHAAAAAAWRSQHRPSQMP